MRKPSRLSLKAEQRRLDELWKQNVADTERWRRMFRPRLLRLFAERTATLAWSRTLLNLLLDELHTEKFFTELVGSPRRLSVHRYPQAVAVAIALRNSGQPDQLTRLAKRLGIALSAKDVPATPPQRSAAPTANKRGRTPGHHRRDSRARLRPVQASPSPPTPLRASRPSRNAGPANGP